jgi:serine/threonine protein kinase
MLLSADDDESVKIIDFGFANDRTILETQLGTPNYIG